MTNHSFKRRTSTRETRRLLINVTLLIVYFLITIDTAFSLVPGRRKEQFPEEPAYYLVPFPYAYPGIGSGVLLLANASNIAESRADITGFLVTGDIGGKVMQLSDLFILPDFLFLGGMVMDLDRITFQNYEKRGMDTEKNDYNYIEATELYSVSSEATITFWERRFELHFFQQEQRVIIPRILDSNGDVIADLKEPYKQTEKYQRIQATLDFTDDRQDPRKGVRFKYSRRDQPRQNEYSPDYYTINQTMEIYIPIGELSTWAFHAFQSDAVVTDPGPTDETTLLQLIELDCEGSDTECLQTQSELVEQFRNMNKNGSSTSLGGLDRLRSYGSGRFQGAHAEYFSTELRLNITEEFTPFDYWIWSDTRTGVQFAMFYETGSVAESKEDLGKEFRSSYGIGLRMVTGSGFVYRADVATGDEGSVPAIWFYYPW
jgi:hypothetical protein